MDKRTTTKTTRVKKEKLGNPRKIRLMEKDEAPLERIAAVNGMDVVSVARMATHAGIPILMEQFGLIKKQEAE